MQALRNGPRGEIDGEIGDSTSGGLSGVSKSSRPARKHEKPAFSGPFPKNKKLPNKSVILLRKEALPGLFWRIAEKFSNPCGDMSENRYVSDTQLPAQLAGKFRSRCARTRRQLAYARIGKRSRKLLAHKLHDSLRHHQQRATSLIAFRFSDLPSI